MRLSRFNYRRPVNEEDEEVPKESGGNQLTHDVRHLRASVSRERKEFDKAENLNKDWKAKMPNRNGKHKTDQARSTEPSKSNTKAHVPFQALRANKPSNVETPKKSFNDAKRSVEHRIQPLQQERDKHKNLKQKEEEYQNILEKFQNIKNSKMKRDNSGSARDLSAQKSSNIVSTPDLGRRVQDSGSKPAKNDQNPYKRENRADLYNSAERKKHIEERRHRKSGQKQKQKRGVEKSSYDPNYSPTNPEDNSQHGIINIDLYKQQLESMNSKSKKSQVTDSEEDFEEITQNIVNGVVVSEDRRKIHSPKRSNNTPYNYNRSKDTQKPTSKELEDILDMNENFDENDIAEEGNGSDMNSNKNKVQGRDTRRLNTDSKIIYEHRPKDSRYSDNLKASTHTDVQLLEESQEIIEFQTDSKTNSDLGERKFDNFSRDYKGNKSNQHNAGHHIQTEPKEEVKQYQNKQNASNKNNKIQVSHERDSPGPKRSAITNSMQKKHLEETGTHDMVFSDENSDSSGDILQNPYNVKMMAPYDQRKEPGSEEADKNRKLNIMYDELEDSGSEGSAILNQEDPNHLASIIEEEEEATDYQRSKSRSKSGTFSPALDSYRNEMPRIENRSSESKPLFTNQVKEKHDEVKDSPDKYDIKVKKAKSAKGVKKEIAKPKIKKKSAEKKDKKKNLDIPVPSEDYNEIRSMKNPSLQPEEKLSQIAQHSAIPDQQNESEKATDDQIENSVKLDEPNQDKSAPNPQVRDRKMRSPRDVSKTVKKVEVEKAPISVLQGPKHLKFIYSILQDLGEEKTLIFSEFLHFYIMLHELVANKKIGMVKTLSPLIERMRRNAGKPETNMPHFLWAFMNPDRHDVLRKKILKDIIKACYDNNSKGRKTLLDSLEEILRNNERDSADTQKNIRLTFNYPGTKRALINFANTISKIDSKISLSRDANTFVTSCIRETFLFQSDYFKDPIQGIETGPVYHEEPEPVQYSANKSLSRYQQFEDPNEIMRQDNTPIPNAQVDLLADDVMMASVKIKNKNGSYKGGNSGRNSENYPREMINNSNNKFKVSYDDDLYDNIQPSEHAYSEQPYYKRQGNKMNVLNFSEGKKLQSQLGKYNHDSHNAYDNRGRPDKQNNDLSLRSDEYNKSLQYRRPINTSQPEYSHLPFRNKTKEKVARSQQHVNVFSLRKNDNQYPDHQYRNPPKARDATPNAKHRVIFEEPEEYQEVQKQVLRSKSSKRVISNDIKTGKKKVGTTKTPIKPPVEQKRRKKSPSVKERSRSASSKKYQSKSKDRNVIGSDSEYEYVKVKKSKDKTPVKYIDSEEEYKPAKKIVINKMKSKQVKTSRKPRYEEEDLEEDSFEARSRSKSQGRKRSLEKSYGAKERSSSQHKPKNEKQTLFQVDINMDSKIVRIAIHKGDNIERIVDKFDSIFNLKSKQKSLLTQRLKTQYDEMIAKEDL